MTNHDVAVEIYHILPLKVKAVLWVFTACFVGFFIWLAVEARKPPVQKALPVGRATAPDEMLANIVLDVQVGEVTYAVSPEAVFVDPERHCWVDPYAVTTKTPTSVKINRDGSGWHVTISLTDYRWVRVKLVDTDKLLLPVETLTISQSERPK